MFGNFISTVDALGFSSAETKKSKQFKSYVLLTANEYLKMHILTVSNCISIVAIVLHCIACVQFKRVECHFAPFVINLNLDCEHFIPFVTIIFNSQII